MHQKRLAPLKPLAVMKRFDMVSHGRPHSYRGSSWGKMLHHARLGSEFKESAKCRTHRKGKPRKKAPRPARRRKSGEAKGRPSHIDRAGLREDPLQHTIRKPGTHRSGAPRENNCPLPKGASLHWFSNAVSSILVAENLCLHHHQGSEF